MAYTLPSLPSDLPIHVVRAIKSVADIEDCRVAQKLIFIVGSNVVAEIGHAKDSREADRWMRIDTPCPRADALRAALVACAAVASRDGDEGAYGWFTAAITLIDGKTPLAFMRDASDPEQFDRFVRYAVEIAVR